MTKNEQIEQLEMEKRALITQLIKARGLLRRIADEFQADPDPKKKALATEAKVLYVELRG